MPANSTLLTLQEPFTLIDRLEELSEQRVSLAREPDDLSKPFRDRHLSQPRLDVVYQLLVLWPQELGKTVNVVRQVVGGRQGLAMDSPQRVVLARIDAQLNGSQPKHHSSVSIFEHVRFKLRQHLLEMDERPSRVKPRGPKTVAMGSLLKLACSTGLKERGAARHHAHDSKCDCKGIGVNQLTVVGDGGYRFSTHDVGGSHEFGCLTSYRAAWR